MNMSRALILTSAIVCAAANDCLSKRDVGNTACGTAGGQRFYYDQKSQVCQPFYYKGCDGNENRFSSRDDCQSACQGVKAPASSNQVEPCAAGNPAAMDDAGVTLTCAQCPTGYNCENGKCCATKESTCNLGYDSGKYVQGQSHLTRYFYSRGMGNCLLFTYFGSVGNPNNFIEYQDCIKFCHSK